jgi:hypothetical protein
MGMLLASLALGCNDNREISSYRAPKPTLPAAQPEVRLLAVIVPRADETWFVKLVGPADTVDRNVKDFEQFVQSLRFTRTAGSPLQWDTPSEWRKGPDAPTRYAAFLMGPEDEQAVLTVVKLGKEAGTLLDNVNRWREQIGLLPLSAFDLDLVTRPTKVNGIAATRVDMMGFRV